MAAPGFVARLALVFAVCVAGSGAARAEAALGVERFEQLSFDLRGRRLSVDERRKVAATPADARDPLYRGFVDAWLDREAVRAILAELVRPISAASLFAGRLTASDGARGRVYSLPGAETSACGADDAVEVSPWWNPARPVRVCRASYVPERVYDKVGYCAGSPEPRTTWPVRAGCGCGPMLVGCLPPREDAPELEASLERGMRAEVIDTALELVMQRRSFDEVFTTTRTLQTGMVELLYARRDVLGWLHAQPYTPALAQRVEARLRAIDLAHPARWIERSGPYGGSGLFTTTPAITTYTPTYRVLVKRTFEDFLCTKFSSVHVDADSVLAAVGSHNGNVRAFGAFGPVLSDSPMRHTPGCQGCHAPLDNTADLFRELATPLYGSIATGQPSEGTMYLTGSTDARGKARGYAGFSALLVAQPEFSQCTVERTFRQLHRRPPLASEQASLAGMTARFDRGGRSLLELVRALVLDPSYTRGER